MARLRNRIRKADYFTDGELLRWHRDKRATYTGLWAIAEDSGCLEDDPFEWKMSIWPSPMDTDVTIEMLERWRDELLDAGKLVAYESEGKRYLYIRTFHQHEHPRNPQVNDLPLPPWVTAEITEGFGAGGKHWIRCLYIVSEADIPARPGICTDQNPSRTGIGTNALPPSVQTPIRDKNRSPVLSGPVRSGAEVKALVETGVPTGAVEDFESWWSAYGRVGDKARARDLYLWWRKVKSATADDLLTAAVSYTSHCSATDCKLKHAATFLAKPTKTKSAIWPEWASGEAHGSMDARRTTHLSDVLTAGAKAFGLIGDDDGYEGIASARLDAGTPAGGALVGCGVPANELDR